MTLIGVVAGERLRLESLLAIVLIYARTVREHQRHLLLVRRCVLVVLLTHTLFSFMAMIAC